MNELEVIEEDKFYKFVNDNIEMVKKYSELPSEDIKFSELNRLMSKFEEVLFTLISLEAVAKREYDNSKKDFDNWFADKFVFIRNRENRADLTAQKWLSYKEIEMLVRIENKQEYSMYLTNLTHIERKVEFIKEIKEGWKSQSFVLNTLSKNVQTEAMIAVKGYNGADL